MFLKKSRAIIAIGIAFATTAQAGIVKIDFVFPKNNEKEVYEAKFNHIKFGEINKDFIKEIKYFDQVWYLVEEKPLISYYIQKNPTTNIISKVLISEHFNNVLAGKDIKHLIDLYSQPTFIEKEIQFANKKFLVTFKIDNNVLTNSNDDRVITEITSRKLDTEKTKTDLFLYENARMVRAKN